MALRISKQIVKVEKLANQICAFVFLIGCFQYWLLSNIVEVGLKPSSHDMVLHSCIHTF